MKARTSVWIASTALAAFLWGCSSSPWAGTWSGLRKPAPGKMQGKQHGYSETKPSLKSSLVLNGDGSYTAKFEEIDYAGTWAADGPKIVLKPKTYMGMERSTFPKPKVSTQTKTIDSLFQPYDLETTADGKTLTHKDDFGVVTFKKTG